MRAFIAFITLALSSFAVAQNVPPCALECVGSADPGSCNPTDNVCLCNNYQFIQSINQCIDKTCKPADKKAAEDAIQALCASAGEDSSPAA